MAVLAQQPLARGVRAERLPASHLPDPRFGPTFGDEESLGDERGPALGEVNDRRFRGARFRRHRLGYSRALQQPLNLCRRRCGVRAACSFSEGRARCGRHALGAPIIQAQLWPAAVRALQRAPRLDSDAAHAWDRARWDLAVLAQEARIVDRARRVHAVRPLAQPLRGHPAEGGVWCRVERQPRRREHAPHLLPPRFHRGAFVGDPPRVGRALSLHHTRFGLHLGRHACGRLRLGAIVGTTAHVHEHVRLRRRHAGALAAARARRRWRGRGPLALALGRRAHVGGGEVRSQAAHPLIVKLPPVAAVRMAHLRDVVARGGAATLVEEHRVQIVHPRRFRRR